MLWVYGHHEYFTLSVRGSTYLDVRIYGKGNGGLTSPAMSQQLSRLRLGTHGCAGIVAGSHVIRHSCFLIFYIFYIFSTISVKMYMLTKNKNNLVYCY